MIENAQPAPQLVDHLFRLEFDESSGIPATWVDTKTLNYLNTLRDNIFASSSQFDIPFSKPESNDKDSKKKKKADTQASSVPPVDKDSVAFQRGKRSCTLSDVNNQQPSSSILQSLKNTQPEGKRNAQQNRPANANLLTQAERLVSKTPDTNQYSDYDFCHNCKQLKNKNLLVSCKYNSKNKGSYG
jgi:hypothetical protein